MRYDDGQRAGASLGQGTVRRVSPKALQVQLVDLARLLWIPLSVIHDDSEVFDTKDNAVGEVFVMAWWAEKEGLS